MTGAIADTTPDRLWLCMTDSNRTRILSRALAKGMGVTVYLGPTVDPDGPIAIMVADDANIASLAISRANAAPNQKTILVTAAAKRSVRADLYLAHDTDAGTLANAIEGVSRFRSFEMTAASRQAPGVISTLKSISFKLQTLDEAGDVAMFLARRMPRHCESAVGLYVLLANAIEHGNLDFSTEDKAQGLASGNWNGKLAHRMAEPDYFHRRVSVECQHGERLISLLIQDDGDGIDAETAEMANPQRAGYRGRGIKLARSLGFAELTWLGTGNMLAATIMMPSVDEDTLPRRATAQ